MKVSIITRAFNRLEYTIQVVNRVRLTADVNYEHIIIDNGSTDGTYEWFKWIEKNNKWFVNMKYIRLERNLGDWKGMVEGLKYVSEDSEYIVQLDNDILTCESWLSSMIYVLENTKYKIVMLHRANVAWKLRPLSMKEILTNGLIISRVERPVACFMMKTELFRQAVKYMKNTNISKYELARLVKGSIVKIINKDCEEIEAPFQRQKYNPKNPNVWQRL